MCVLHQMIGSVLVFLAASAASSSPEDEPRFMRIFKLSTEWIGSYTYKELELPCYMYIHSSHFLRDDAIMATFKDKDATIDMDGTSSGTDELQVTFETTLLYHGGDRFLHNFTLRGHLSKVDGNWFYDANATGLIDNPRVLFRMHQLGATVSPTTYDDEDNSWRLGVVIGIPILLALVGVVGTVAIVYWAIKKGYIRHVPKSYGNFRNERNESVAFDNSKETVHI